MSDQLVTLATLAKNVKADPRTLAAALRGVEPEAELVQPSGKSLPLYNAERTSLIAQELLAQAGKYSRTK
jgi:hypothetical protein